MRTPQLVLGFLACAALARCGAVKTAPDADLRAAARAHRELREEATADPPPVTSGCDELRYTSGQGSEADSSPTRPAHDGPPPNGPEA